VDLNLLALYINSGTNVLTSYFLYDFLITPIAATGLVGSVGNTNRNKKQKRLAKTAVLSPYFDNFKALQ